MKVNVYKKNNNRCWVNLIEYKEETVEKKSYVTLVLISIIILTTILIFIKYKNVSIFFPLSIEVIILFFIIIDKKKVSSLNLSLIGALSALSVVGRVIFYSIPNFKPVLAMTVIGGILLGGVEGFLIGALSMMLSSVFFAIGIYTPFQMVAMGLVGFFSGVLFFNKKLGRVKLIYSIYGFLSAFIIYGLIMNLSVAFLWGRDKLNIGIILSYIIAGIPFDGVHGVSSFLFLYTIGDKIIDKVKNIM